MIKALRLSKLLLIAALAFHMALVVMTNFTAPELNYAYIQNVSNMSSVPAEYGWRSVQNESFHWLFFYFITAVELLTFVFLGLGVFQMFKNSRAKAEQFHQAKRFAVYGLLTGLLLWIVLMIGIGGEWFMTWQSEKWNAVPQALRKAILYLGVLIFLSMPEQEDKS
jgi:predicted small integral membrane protein